MKETTPDLTRISKYISLILRHKPEVIGIKLDTHGWADVNALLAGISRKYPINRDILEEIVRSDEKQRYSFSEDGTKIRANQGHSIQVDVELPVTEPPETLYHGTAQRFAASIEAQGLLRVCGLFVLVSAVLVRDCSPRAACMFIFHRIRKQRRKLGAGMENL